MTYIIYIAIIINIAIIEIKFLIIAHIVIRNTFFLHNKTFFAIKSTLFF